MPLGNFDPSQAAEQVQSRMAPAASQSQGLPQTGLQRQMESLNQLYDQVGGMPDVGFDVRQQQFQAGLTGGAQQELQFAPDAATGSTSIDQMARNLAQQYGLPIGRGRLVDEYGNFLVTPQQLADASGGQITQGEAAAQMNYIAQAIARRQNEQQQEKGMAALQTGLGLVQSRGRGSMAALTSGYYRDIADLYANQEYEAADFSYYIQKEQLEIQQELMRRTEELAEKQARGGFITGLGMGVAGLATGNFGLALGGFGAAGGQAAGTGWF